ncbi:Dihydroorotate dehydrogenase (quinone), mitochondrial [Chytriomyces hyalinus]|nr:Dihydroorotate dehydrogenase (quinone), mitochondrial [Chytriomyces hyalinus]
MHRLKVGAQFLRQARNSSSSSSNQPRSGSSTAKNVGLVAVGLTAALYAGFVLSDTRALFHRVVSLPLLHTLDPERAHVLSIALARMGLCPREGFDPDLKDHRLQSEVFNLSLSNPIGLAAGYDKHAEAMDALLGFGFGLVEIGSVTPQPQPGNPLPRMFRLSQDNAVINRYGFNSDGHAAVQARLSDRLAKWMYSVGLKTLPEDIPRSLKVGTALGVNLGKNKVSAAEDNSDYVKGVVSLGRYADYVVVNISSPNTPGLRSLQRREPMLQLLKEVKAARDAHVQHNPPLLVKIAPDVSMDELEDIAAVVKEARIDGVIISNTTLSRPSYLKSEHKNETGGLSGPPVFPLALEKVRAFYALTHGSIPIIGCGGISNGAEALAMAKAGASLVQVYTALGYQGPGLVHDMKRDLVELLEKEGTTWKAVVGADHRV